jgi:uncharacterized membrane protein YjfL (UPF0719 family)
MAAAWNNINSLIASVVYSAVGMVMLGLGFYIYDKITPWRLWKEVIDEHNIALSIIVAAMVLGISNIIASAITG